MLKPFLRSQDNTVTGSVDEAAAGRWALSGLALSMLLSALGTSITNVGLPTLVQVFEAPFRQVQWVVLAYLLAITVLIVSVGRLGDLVGRRRLLLAGLVLFTVASVLCSVAPTLGLLVAARALQGLGAAAMMALTMAFVGEVVPEARTGRAMGLLGTMSAVGTALGPSLGGVLIAGFGWRALFLVNLPLGVLALWLTYRHLPVDRPRTAVGMARLDPVGTVLLALGLLAYTLAMTLGRGQFGVLNVALLAVAAVGAGLFMYTEARVSTPLVPLRMFRDPDFSAGLAMNVLVATVMMAMLVVGPFYLSRTLGLEPAAVGVVMALGPVIAAFSGVPAGRLVDHRGAAVMRVAGLVGMVLGSAALVVLPVVWGVAGYVVAIAVLTPGYQLFQAANNTAAMRGIRTDQRGVVYGLLNLSRNLGLVTGASAMGAVFASAAATSNFATAQPAAVATGLQATFAVATVLGGVALLLAAKRS